MLSNLHPCMTVLMVKTVSSICPFSLKLLKPHHSDYLQLKQKIHAPDSTLQHFYKIQIKDMAGTSIVIFSSDMNQGAAQQVEAGSCPVLSPAQVRNKVDHVGCLSTRALTLWTFWSSPV